jgi:hypothetical protein
LAVFSFLKFLFAIKEIEEEGLVVRIPWMAIIVILIQCLWARLIPSSSPVETLKERYVNLGEGFLVVVIFQRCPLISGSVVDETYCISDKDERLIYVRSEAYTDA